MHFARQGPSESISVKFGAAKVKIDAAKVMHFARQGPSESTSVKFDAVKVMHFTRQGPSESISVKFDAVKVMQGHAFRSTGAEREHFGQI